MNSIRDADARPALANNQCSERSTGIASASATGQSLALAALSSCGCAACALGALPPWPASASRRAGLAAASRGRPLRAVPCGAWRRLLAAGAARGARVEQADGLLERDGLRRHVGRQRGVDAVMADIGAVAAVLDHDRAALVGMIAERAAGIGAEAAALAGLGASSRRSASPRG